MWNPAFNRSGRNCSAVGALLAHQIFYKPAHHGGVVIWHQDYSYWTRTLPMSHLSCWIGLDDSTREQWFILMCGSHRWNLLPREDFANVGTRFKLHSHHNSGESLVRWLSSKERRVLVSSTVMVHGPLRTERGVQACGGY